jgi:hypothetical protein
VIGSLYIMGITVSSDITVQSVTNSVADIEVLTVQVPGVTGPQGSQGAPGASNVISIGTVTTGASGSNAGATISGVSPNQVLNLTIPQGPTGAAGAAGPANTLTIGTVNTVAGTTGGSATITGTSPNQILNLVLPRGYGVIPAGAAGDVLVKNSGTDYDTKWSTPAVASTANTLVLRDGSGQSGFGFVSLGNAPTDISHSTRKDYVDAQVATKAAIAGDLGGTAAAPTVTGGTHHGHTSSQISDAASASTASVVMKRDSAGRASVADPAASTDITTKNYVDLADANLQTQINTNSTNIGNKAAIAGDLGGTAASPTVTGGTHHSHTSSQISDAASASTASKVIIRDAAGRASVVDPAASTDISTKNYTDTQDAAMRRVLANSQGATAYTFVLTDEGKVVYYSTDNSPVTYTIPPNSSVAFPIGAFIDVWQGGSGAVTISPGAGVSLRGPDGTASVTLRNTYSKVRLSKVNTDSWQVQGDTSNIVTTAVNNAQSASAGGAGQLIKRDINSRAQVADPSAAQDIATKNYVDIQDIATNRVSGQNNFATTAYTLALSDEQKIIYYNTDASPWTVTVPTNATVPFAQGAWIDIYQGGAGQATVACAAGVQLRVPDGSVTSATTRAQFSKIRLTKSGTDIWQVSGDVTTVTDTAVNGATNAATANAIAKRDSSGQLTVSTMLIGNATPSLNNEVARKDYVDNAAATKVTNGAGVSTIKTMTAAAYAALGTKDAATLYVIVG